jgi:hypothetical protein
MLLLWAALGWTFVVLVLSQVLVLAMVIIVWRFEMNLYEKIGAVLKAAAAREAQLTALQQQFAGLNYALNKLVEGLAAIYGVSLESLGQKKVK